MDEFGKLAFQELEVRRATHRQIFWLHLVVWALTGLLLFVVWLLATPHAMPWFIIPVLAWGIFLGGHAAWVFMIRSPQEIIMDRERRTMNAATPAEYSDATAGRAVAQRVDEGDTTPIRDNDPLTNADQHAAPKATS